MSQPRVPSLQHLCRNWHADPKKIAADLVEVTLNPPRGSYNQLYSAIIDLLVFGQSFEQVERGLKIIRNEKTRNMVLGVLPLIREYCSGLKSDYFQLLDRRLYSVGRSIQIPFAPPMIYGVGGQIIFPWFMFWQSNPLRSERLSLFVTLVEEMLLQDPDLESAKFSIVDFSCPNSKAPRKLRISDATEIERVSDHRKKEMLETYVEGYKLAVAQLASNGNKVVAEKPDNRKPDFRQPGLFD